MYALKYLTIRDFDRLYTVSKREDYGRKYCGRSISGNSYRIR